MPVPAYITFILNGEKIKGSVTFPGKEGTSEAHEFSHEVKFIEQDWFTGKIVREHSPVVFIKPVDAISVTLYQLLCRGEIIDKVHIDWYKQIETTNKEEIYFQHILEKAKVCTIEMIMHNVKDRRYEQYPCLEKITLRYDRIAWVVPRGNIIFTDRWYYAYLMTGMNLSDQDEWNKIQEQAAVTDSMDEEEEQQQEQLSVTNPRWEHTDEKLKQDSPDKASAGDTIRLMADIAGFVPGGKVTFDVYDISKDTPQRLETVYGKNNGGRAFAEWKVEDPRKEPDMYELKLGFEASARSKYSVRCDIAIGNAKTVSILEIEDCMFRFDSAVFLPDGANREEKGKESQEALSGLEVIRAILNRAYKYNTQKILVAGHTDRSGSEEYNFELSKKRSLAVVSILENDKESWKIIADEKHTNEDIQHILKWIAVFKTWNCDPGEIDGIIGSQSTAAIKEFQTKSGLNDDGVVGQKTWGAIFDVYQQNLESIMSGELDALNGRSSLNWAYTGKGVGCGELWPISDQMKSQTDRRVEVLFFEENEYPECCVNGVCKKENCKIYTDGLFEKCYIALDGTAFYNLTVKLEEKEEGITVEISGPENKSGLTDANGEITFKGIKIGKYKVVAKMEESTPS